MPIFPAETPWSKKEREENKKKSWIMVGVVMGISALMSLIVLLL